LESWKIL